MLTVHWFLHTCIFAFIILLYVDNIHEIYMLQVESNRWNLIFLCVASMPLLWIIALWVNSYARLIDACLESTIHEKSLLYDSVVYSLSLPLLWIAAFITYAYNSIDQDHDGMSLQKLSLLSFTYSGRVGTKLGDACYVSNVSIISYVPCYFYDDTHMFYTHYMSLLCIFQH